MFLPCLTQVLSRCDLFHTHLAIPILNLAINTRTTHLGPVFFSAPFRIGLEVFYTNDWQEAWINVKSTALAEKQGRDSALCKLQGSKGKTGR